jgi:hypothetical protein
MFNLRQMKGETVEKLIRAGALIAGMVLGFGLMSILLSADWIAVWNANSEPDLAGYLLDVNADGKTTTYSVGLDTSFTFQADGDSVCAVVYAYDAANNMSDPSEVVCAVDEPKNPFDLNGDGIVNRQDYLDEIHPRYGSTPVNELYDRSADLNEDGIINRGDYLELRKHYGEITN